LKIEVISKAACGREDGKSKNWGHYASFLPSCIENKLLSLKKACRKLYPTGFLSFMASLPHGLIDRKIGSQP
jgi:hypothetical protein